jgi:H+/Cl- antiporter ClcA
MLAPSYFMGLPPVSYESKADTRRRRRPRTIAVLAAILSLVACLLAATVWIGSWHWSLERRLPFMPLGFYISAGRFELLLFGSDTVETIYAEDFWVIVLASAAVFLALCYYIFRRAARNR